MGIFVPATAFVDSGHQLNAFSFIVSELKKPRKHFCDILNQFK